MPAVLLGPGRARRAETAGPWTPARSRLSHHFPPPPPLFTAPCDLRPLAPSSSSVAVFLIFCGPPSIAQPPRPGRACAQAAAAPLVGHAEGAPCPRCSRLREHHVTCHFERVLLVTRCHLSRGPRYLPSPRARGLLAVRHPPHTWALAPLHAGPGWGRVVPADRCAEGPLAGGDGGQGLTGRTRAGGGSAACLAITLRLQLFIERLGKVSF